MYEKEATLESGAGTNGLHLEELLNAAAHTLNNQRCQEAYLHELRGGLQALSTSLELLARSAQNGATAPATIERATSLAKRALTNPEHSMSELLAQLVDATEEPALVNAADLIEDTQRFLRADAARREIRMTNDGDRALQIRIPRNRLRRLILELLTLAIDDSPRGAEVQLRVSRAAENACVEMHSAVVFSADEAADPALGLRENLIPRKQLILADARHWLPKLGGRLEVARGIGTTGVVQIHCPLSRA